MENFRILEVGTSMVEEVTMKKLIVPQDFENTDMPKEKKTWYSLILEFGLEPVDWKN